MGIQVKKAFSFILWYLLIAFIQSVSAWVTIRSINPWYQNLQKAPWTPPDWVFSPIWTLLYLMMALSVWLIYWTKSTKKLKSTSYALFFIQLFTNGLWSILFFGLHNPLWALIDLCLLIVLVTITTIYFYRIKPLAGLLFIPYILWLTYALSLNAAVWWLNINP